MVFDPRVFYDMDQSIELTSSLLGKQCKLLTIEGVGVGVGVVLGVKVDLSVICIALTDTHLSW
jgi:hypothetical protein